MRYYRTTGLAADQMQELVRRVSKALGRPWQKETGRPRACGLYRAVEIACMYLRQNITQELIGDACGVSQPCVSRIVKDLVPLVREVLAEFVPSAKDATQMVKGRIVLVDGTLTPIWSYRGRKELWNKKHQATGFNVQLISLLDGTPVWISEPLPGKTHDAKAYRETGAEKIVKKSSGGLGDKGYQGCGMTSPQKKPQHRKLTGYEKQYNRQVSSLRAPVERLVAHFKNWKIFHTDYRRPYETYRDAYEAGRALFFFSATWGFE
jgi:DDE superfamily endonuclease/Helix-turn-helix of DDE superfamily endonuclease